MSSQPAAVFGGRRAADDIRPRLLAGTTTGIIMQEHPADSAVAGIAVGSTLGTLGAAVFHD
jgi:hypothetical protein